MLGCEIGDVVLQLMVIWFGGLGVCYGMLVFQLVEDFVLVIGVEYDIQCVLDDLLQIVLVLMCGKDLLYQFELCIGVVVYIVGDGYSVEQVIGMVVQVVYVVCVEGNVVVWFDVVVIMWLVDCLCLVGCIYVVIDNEFQLYFQLIWYVSDGSLVVLEVLLCWLQVDGSFILFNEFIQLCEDIGLILVLGCWVICVVVKVQWWLVEVGWGELLIVVNVLVVQFFNSDLVVEFICVQQEFGLVRGVLYVELIESSLMCKLVQVMQIM